MVTTRDEIQKKYEEWEQKANTQQLEEVGGMKNVGSKLLLALNC